MATHIAATFFASEDPVTGLLKTFAVFAVAFALRPLGGIFFGRRGDRLGRKKILVLTALLMSGSTAAIGLIPSHESIGVWAAVLLVAARCLQGFSAGGEYAGATIYVVEHSPDRHRARYSCAMSAATFFSFALAAGLGALLSFLLPAESLGAWGWRLLFLLSAPMGRIAFYIRAKLHESPSSRPCWTTPSPALHHRMAAYPAPGGRHDATGRVREAGHLVRPHLFHVHGGIPGHGDRPLPPGRSPVLEPGLSDPRDGVRPGHALHGSGHLRNITYAVFGGTAPLPVAAFFMP